MPPTSRRLRPDINAGESAALGEPCRVGRNRHPRLMPRSSVNPATGVLVTTAM
jgi:hypothetical protein